jgi:hypothetical protein
MLFWLFSIGRLTSGSASHGVDMNHLVVVLPLIATCGCTVPGDLAFQVGGVSYETVK